MIAFATAQFLIFSGYAYYIYKKYGVLQSISTSAYKLPHNKHWKFSVSLFLTGILQLPIVIMGDLSTWLFLPMLGLLYTGFSTRFRKGIQRSIHYGGVVGAIVVQFLVMWLAHGLWVPMIIVPLLVLASWKWIDKNLVWWVELEIMAIVYLTYLYYFIKTI